MNRQASLVFGDFHFHTTYSDNEDKATVRQMVDAGRARGLRTMAPADHHHSLTPADWAALLDDIDELAKSDTGDQLYEACEISFRRGHLVAIRPEGFPRRVADAFRILYEKRCEAMIIAHPVRIVDRWRHILYPAVDGIEVINGEVLRYFRKRRIPFRRFDSIPMLSLYKHYLRAGLPVAAVGSSDAHRIPSVGFGVTGLWLHSADDTAMDAIRERRCYAATDTGVFMKWSLDGRTLSWETAIDGGAPHKVRVYRGSKRICAVASHGDMTLAKAGCYWIAIGTGERIGVSSAIEATPYHIAKIRKRQLAKILRDAAYLQRQESGSNATVWGWRRRAKWMAVYADAPRFYDQQGKRLRLPSFPLPGRRVFARKKDSISALADVEPWISRNEAHEYAFAEITWDTRRTDLRIRGTAVPGLRAIGPSWTRNNISTLESIKKAANKSATIDLQLRVMRRWLVRLPPGSGTYTIRDAQRESILGTVAVQLPEQFRKRARQHTRKGSRSGAAENLSTEIQVFT
jgi:hypothetical protein